MDRPREFQTADGFVMQYDEARNDWCDGERAFAARQGDLWPVDAAGEPLAGRFIYFGYAPPPGMADPRA
jgi:hypothetical protein